MAGLGDYSKYASMGISWVVTTGVYLYIGYRGGMWLDARWQTEPIFFIIGILIGMALSVLTLVKELMALTDAGVMQRRDSAGSRHGRDSERNNFPKDVDPKDTEGNPQGRNGRHR